MPDGEREWIERWLGWCAEQFGSATEVRREVALPGFAGWAFDGGQGRAEALVRQVGAVMGADVSRVRVLLVDSPQVRRPGRHQVGEYRRVLGGAVIELERQVAERPDSFVALVAHELAHARLVGEWRTDGLRMSQEEQERLTDLTTVFLGMGVLTANAADSYVKTVDYSVTPLGDLTDRMLTGRGDAPSHHLGYLNPSEFGYALACWSRMRGESAPVWAGQLTASVRVAFRQGLTYLTRSA